MRSKNSAAITPAEREHMGWVKSLPCAVCDAPAPSEAHHIEQGFHFTTIPLCRSCHRDEQNGLHGARVMWKIMRKTELSCLNETVGKLRDGVSGPDWP